MLAGAVMVLAASASAQSSLRETMARHGVAVRDRGIEGAFDDGVEPAMAVTPGSFAAPLAMLSSGQARDRQREKSLRRCAARAGYTVH